MKNLLATILVILSSLTTAYAQKIEKYFDYKWLPCEPNMARFYALIEHTDSGWLRRDYFLAEKSLQMQALYQDSACKIANGHFYFFHPNGILSSAGVYTNNKREGLWIGIYQNGVMSDSTVYTNGVPTGISLQWFDNGYMSDSTVYHGDGSAVAVSWFDDGSISSAGRLNPLHHVQGKWQYFHRNGKLSANEVYDNGVLVDRKYFAEDGSPMADTTNKTRPAQFSGGIPGWLKFLEKKLYFPNHYQIINGDKAVVVVDFTIDEDGNVKNVTIQTPFHRVFNDIAVKVVKSSPKWIPAMEHNRKVSYTHRQTVNFNQVTY